MYSLIACNPKTNHVQSPCFYDKPISRIMVYNKTTNKFIASQIVITKQEEIKDIQKELFNLAPSGAGDAKANFGFYQLELIYSDGQTSSFSIIYSTYNGVLISCSGVFYKDNGLESLILSKFQEL
ncbi:MAG TPA: hypothetical protein VF609_00935 [Flavisolibacter sp.]